HNGTIHSVGCDVAYDDSRSGCRKPAGHRHAHATGSPSDQDRFCVELHLLTSSSLGLLSMSRQAVARSRSMIAAASSEVSAVPPRSGVLTPSLSAASTARIR